MLLPPRAELPLSSSPPRAGTAAPSGRTARRPALTLSASNSRPTRRASRSESTVVGQHRHRQDYIAPRCRSAVRSAGECVPAAQPRDARNRRRSPRRRDAVLWVLCRGVVQPGPPSRRDRPHDPGPSPLRPSECRPRCAPADPRSGLPRPPRALRQPATKTTRQANRRMDQSTDPHGRAPSL